MSSDSPKPHAGETSSMKGTPEWSHGAALRRALAFVALFLLLQSLYSAAQGSWVERLVIEKMTVQTAAWIIDFAAPSVGVVAEGSRLRAPGGGINVINGCEGVDVAFLMACAMLVAPQSMRSRLMGLLVGSAVVFALNQVRVVGLFYVFRFDPAVFDMVHGVLAPLLLIIAAGAFFVIWLNRHATLAEQPA